MMKEGNTRLAWRRKKYEKLFNVLYTWSLINTIFSFLLASFPANYYPLSFSPSLSSSLSHIHPRKNLGKPLTSLQLYLIPRSQISQRPTCKYPLYSFYSSRAKIPKVKDRGHKDQVEPPILSDLVILPSNWWDQSKEETGQINSASSSELLRYPKVSLDRLQSTIFDAVSAVPILQVACCSVRVENASFFRVQRTCPGGSRKHESTIWEMDALGHKVHFTLSSLGNGKREHRWL